MDPPIRDLTAAKFRAPNYCVQNSVFTYFNQGYNIGAFVTLIDLWFLVLHLK